MEYIWIYEMAAAVSFTLIYSVVNLVKVRNTDGTLVTK